ncbi:MAG: hypothetical protein ABI655_05610 [Phenylobacterium sp.]
MEAEAPEREAELCLAFQRVSRSVRQTLALEARLVRERQRQAREDHQDAAREREARIAPRRTRVRTEIERVISREVDPCDGRLVLTELDECLAEDDLAGRFDDEAVEAQIARLRARLGLTARSPAEPGFRPRQGVTPTPVADHGLPGRPPPDPNLGDWAPPRRLKRSRRGKGGSP